MFNFFNTYTIGNNLKNWFKENVKPNWVILEYGSGDSTIFLSKLCKCIYSIEHNPKYYLETYKKIIENNIKNVRLYLREEKAPYIYFEGDEIDIDLVFVDGIYRNECMIWGKTITKKYLVLHDAERNNYYDLEYFKNFRLIHDIALNRHFATWSKIYQVK